MHKPAGIRRLQSASWRQELPSPRSGVAAPGSIPTTPRLSRSGSKPPMLGDALRSLSVRRPSVIDSKLQQFAHLMSMHETLMSESGRITLRFAMQARDLFDMIDSKSEGFLTAENMIIWLTDDSEARKNDQTPSQESSDSRRKPSRGNSLLKENFKNDRRKYSFVTRTIMDGIELAESFAGKRLEAEKSAVLVDIPMPAVRKLIEKLNKACSDHGGRLKFVEFLAILFPTENRNFLEKLEQRVIEKRLEKVDILNPMQNEELLEIFQMIDVDQDGSITRDELVKVASGSGSGIDEKEVLELFSLFDTNGDGVVNFNEFKALMSGTYLRSFFHAENVSQVIFLSKERYPPSSVDLARELPQNHLCNEILQQMEELQNDTYTTIRFADSAQPAIKGFLLLHDRTASDFQQSRWKNLLFCIGSNNLLTYTLYGSEVEVGKLDSLLHYHTMEYVGSPSGWAGMYLEFDESVGEENRVLRLSARNEREAEKWLDLIASRVPRFRIPHRPPRQYQIQMERPDHASLQILQTSNLMVPKRLEDAGWYVVHEGQMVQERPGFLAGVDVRIVLFKQKQGEDVEIRLEDPDETLFSLKRKLNKKSRLQERAAMLFHENLPDLMECDDDGTNLSALGKNLFLLDSCVVKPEQFVLLPMQTDDPNSAMLWKIHRLRTGICLRDKSQVTHTKQTAQRLSFTGDFETFQKKREQKEEERKSATLFEFIITIREIFDLPGIEYRHPSFYCKVSVGNQEFRTKTIKLGMNNEWQQTFRFAVPTQLDGYGREEIERHSELRIVVYERHTESNKSDEAVGFVCRRLNLIHGNILAHKVETQSQQALDGSVGSARRKSVVVKKSRSSNKSPENDRRRPEQATTDDVDFVYKLSQEGKESSADQPSISLSLRFEVSALGPDSHNKAANKSLLQQRHYWDHDEHLLWWLEPSSFSVIKQTQDGIGALQILVIRAVGLLASDPDGFSDPFVQLSLGPLVARTQAKRRTLNPFWNESFLLEYASDTTELKAKIIDQDPSAEQPIGTVLFPISRLVAGETLCQWFPIIHGTINAGQLLLLLRLPKVSSSPRAPYRIKSLHIKKPGERAKPRQAQSQVQSSKDITIEHMEDASLLELGSCPLHTYTVTTIKRWQRSRGFLHKLSSVANGTEASHWRKSLFLCENGLLSYYSTNRRDGQSRKVAFLFCADIESMGRYGPDLDQTESILKSSSRKLFFPSCFKVLTCKDPRLQSGRDKGLQITFVFAANNDEERDGWMKIISDQKKKYPSPQ